MIIVKYLKKEYFETNYLNIEKFVFELETISERKDVMKKKKILKILKIVVVVILAYPIIIW